MKTRALLISFALFGFCIFPFHWIYSEPSSEPLESPIQEHKSNPTSSTLYPNEKRILTALDLETAELLLWKNNLSLLAMRFQVDAKKAGILQAGLYANPNIALDQSIYAEPTQRWFDFSRAGQTSFQLQQVFLLGGKIDKRVRVAEASAKISEQEFYDVARALLTNLRRDFYSIFYLKQALLFYDASIVALEKTVSSSELAYKRRAILKAEYLRVKALLFFLKKEREELVGRILEKEADLKVLLNTEKFSSSKVTLDLEMPESRMEELTPGNLKVDELLSIARDMRPDLRVALQALRYEEANLELQHANAIPDLSLGPSYNRAGTAFQNYWGMSVQLTVPIFDRNQGNILASEKSILARKQELKNKILEVENEVIVAFEKARLKDELFKKFTTSYTQEYANLAEDMILSYEKRYITILEFADFFETYRSSVVEMLKLQTDRMDAIENVNFTVGQGVLIPRKYQ